MCCWMRERAAAVEIQWRSGAEDGGGRRPGPAAAGRCELGPRRWERRMEEAGGMAEERGDRGSRARRWRGKIFVKTVCFRGKKGNLRFQ